MKVKGKIVWEDLPKPINAFTVRHASMLNLNTGEIVQYYSANTKIVVAQKALTEQGTFYRTASAEHHSLNWAFEASALGLPDGKAPLVQSEDSYKLGKSRKPAEKKTNTVSKKDSPRAEGEPRKKGFLARIFHKS